ncbi:MAG: hypothetical protein HUU55_07795 [Myxococcales bacterium]|nr:hypothetical protein [Myxococcales bacterium]
MVESSTDSYQDFIREVFIDPIRTAVLVDDECPTFRKLLDADVSGETPTSRGDGVKIAKTFIELCRTRRDPWLMDVHDGNEPQTGQPEDAVSHLTHSDLLLLDYHLDPQNPSSGDKAIGILRHLAANDHFNLVVVYTKGDDGAAGNVAGQFAEIAIGLSFRERGKKNWGELNEVSADKLAQIEDKLPDLWRQLEDVDDLTILRFWQEPDRQDATELLKDDQLAGFSGLLKKVATDAKVRKLAVLERLFDRVGSSRFNDKMSNKDYGRVWFANEPDGINWIRTDSLFVTVVSKKHPVEELPKRLLRALVAWDPDPHRLIVAKMRALLDQNGSIAEAGVLQDRALQAAWLREIFESGKEEEVSREARVRRNIGRHWETLGFHIEQEGALFGAQIVAFLNASLDENVDDALKRFKLPREEKESVLHMNRYVCSKPIAGAHLSTGHVLLVRDECKDKRKDECKDECKVECKKKERYFVCVTPACDIVPDQGGGWRNELKKWVPFKAVEITKRSDKKRADDALVGATEARNLFLTIEPGKSEINVFALYRDNREQGRLHWEHFFVDNYGKFQGNGPPAPIELKIAMIKPSNDSLVFVETTARVVAHLRYEYALHLLHRLGAQLSRVGLGFVAPKKNG